MVARLLALGGLILSVACGSSTIGIRGGEDSGAASMTLAGTSESSSTDDFDVTVDQPDAPMVMRGVISIDVRYVITVTNRMKSPLMVKRISLESIGNGDYQVPLRSRPFKKTIASGAKEKFQFWATASVNDSTVGTRAPLTMRTSIVAETADGERQEHFLRRVNGRGAIGLSGT